MTSKGEFVFDRNNDKLTVALNKPKHPGHTRGYGVRQVSLDLQMTLIHIEVHQLKGAIHLLHLV
jgi:hypothetical protein